MKESNYNVWVEEGNSAYVFNGISTALLHMSLEERRLLRDWLAGTREIECPRKLLQQLRVGRMLVPDDEDEVAMLAQRYAQSRHANSSLRLTIVTSLGCNFDCPYCFEAKEPSILSEEVAQCILQVLDSQLPRVTRFAVTWFGGEPLLGKQSLLSLSKRFIERCNDAGVGYGADIITNGFLLNEQTCRELREHRVHHAQVTLDGPPEVHDRMRPQVNGTGSFWQIVRNLKHAVEFLDITVRMNLDRNNHTRAEELLQILSEQGLAGKLTVCPGQIVGVDDGAPAPSSRYQSCCMTNQEYAIAEQKFYALARSYGFAGVSLPQPVGSPCTAVRTNELIVGSKGELYKCFESVGNSLETVGNIRDYLNPNGRLHKWLNYDPFANEECRSCIALPSCMGGCAHHAMDKRLYENRCSSFRHTYREQILAYVEAARKKTAVAP